MRKALMVFAFIAALFVGGTAAPAQAAPQQSGVKWTSVQTAGNNSTPKHLSPVKAAPSTALFKSKTCSAGDTGYRVLVEIDYIVVSGKVDINKVYSQFEHRKLGLWAIEDWASSSTDTVQNAGNTWGSFTRNPGAKNNWYTASPVFTPNGLKAGVLKASGSGTSVGACLVALP